MADGNNLKERVVNKSVEQLAQAVTQGAEVVSGAIAGAFTDLTNALVAKVAEVVEEKTITPTVDVETTDKILNGAMNNSRFDIKVSLAEGILNGLFCGSLLTVNIYNYGSNPQAPATEAAKPEES